jgi:hypothetical protein
MILLVSTLSVHAFPRTLVLDGWVGATATQPTQHAQDRGIVLSRSDWRANQAVRRPRVDRPKSVSEKCYQG